MPGIAMPRAVFAATNALLRRAPVVAVAVCLTALATTGCGGGAHLSNKALATKGDAICERLREAINAADEQADEGNGLPNRAKLSVLYAAAEERASNQLAALEPEGVSAEREWQQVVALRRGLIPYHHLMTKYASLGDLDKLEATYTAYKAAQWQMRLGFKHSRFGFKICWDIG